MAISTESYTELKSALKDALVELIQERQDLFYEIVREVLNENGATSATVQDETKPQDSEETFDAQVQAEIQAYHRMHPMLWEKYPSEYVAIHNQELVDHDSDKVALYKRIREKYPHRFVLRRQVNKEPERDIHLRSNRIFVKEL